jgi:hypothetical protein
MPLTDTACKNAKPKDKPCKLSDEKGMFLLITPNGANTSGLNTVLQVLKRF